MNRTFCKLTQLVLPTLFLALVLSTPFAASAASDASCVKQVKNNCLACHQETRICQKINKNKGEGAWKNTVKRMVRHGAQVNETDQELLVKCLSAPDAGIRELCPKK